MTLHQLEQTFRRVSHLQHVSAILQWDEAVMMASAGGDERARAMATLGSVVHEHLTASEVTDWLASAEEESAAGQLDQLQRANLREMKRAVRRARALPGELVEASSRAQMRCQQAWRVQRAENDWPGFAPLLQEVLARKRECASALAEALQVSSYDALLDEYEPFYSSAKIDQLFGRLREFLPSLIAEAVEHQRARPRIVPRGKFPVAAQQRLALRLMSSVGFDMTHGRLDVSHHPFCGGVPSDVRVTSRYDESDFVSGMMGVLHETGHAKYEQNRPLELREQPVGEPRGMSTHEGQSLLSEMQIGRTHEFLQFAAPLIAEAFADAAAAQPEAFSVDNLVRLLTHVECGKIRVGADEVTYPCHILVRYDIERRLIDGDLTVKDIPDAWDAGMRELLGVATADDYRNGCMQDVHWPSGAFGYFPTYTLGAMTAAQMFAAIKRALPDVGGDLARGSFDAINDFLLRNVWSVASVYTTDELMERATGEVLNPKYFEAHLRERYVGTPG
jgi:carboxypeptidase Taq